MGKPSAMVRGNPSMRHITADLSGIPVPTCPIGVLDSAKYTRNNIYIASSFLFSKLQNYKQTHNKDTAMYAQDDDKADTSEYREDLGTSNSPSHEHLPADVKVERRIL